MQKKIFVSVTNDMSNDQRVNRVCNSLAKKGLNVVVLCRKLKNTTTLNNTNYAINYFRLIFNKGVAFYASINLRIFFYLLFHKCDLLVANDLDTLLPNALISKIKRIPLYYDSHELFTEVPELQNRKFIKKVWLFIERFCIKQAKASYTVCNSIADIYNQKYNINMKVVRNLPTSKTQDNYSFRKNIFLYQGALNEGRGIELLIEMMPYFPDYKLYIAGKGYLEKSLKKLVEVKKLDNQVVFTGNLPFSDLHLLTSQAKIGFSIEQGTSLNYKFALPNKIFDYIQAATPVVCSNLPEMKAVVEKYRVGKIFAEHDTHALATLVEEMLSNHTKLIEYHNNCLATAKILNWESEEKILYNIYNIS